MGASQKALIDGGIDVPRFACNPPGSIANGYRDDLFQVVNFKPGAAKRAFETLRKFQKTGPLMNDGFYPAWFDIWGLPHRTTDVRSFLGDLDSMLKNHQSFNIYMAHAGTSFGLWVGADRPFRPDASSYDCDVPISGAGGATESFDRLRELFGKHLLPGETLPPVPTVNGFSRLPWRKSHRFLQTPRRRRLSHDAPGTSRGQCMISPRCPWREKRRTGSIAATGVSTSKFRREVSPPRSILSSRRWSA